ncbi:tetratricopeptide repeat protein [Acetonema longum]|uniref:Sel1 repeat-containing protein n=1 Tax=Acetonema longum DSM 6540 TaxID=1009370 RepID=F7NNL3_9FIRM|nr:tetratricopeptide repeat protein [Acetonema longum]EGO62369.1 Sel1 repeat-containing protein [Acetonema longum DSM 6540]
MISLNRYVRLRFISLFTCIMIFLAFSWIVFQESPVEASSVSDLRQAADKGDAAAQYKLGIAYEEGNGVEKDLAEAIKWWKLSAEQGDSDAQHMMGNVYMFGYGAEKNFPEGLKWWKKAADQGNPSLNSCLD